MEKQVIVDEKLDSLEIFSIGKLYQGPLEKKYWSSSRGKDRHPYPVGYEAARTFNGSSYKMEIIEGLKGPDFVISSTDGQSCSGQTPDIAWEGFQKKNCIRIKLRRGKRHPCKIDGVEIFGFKNPLVKKLLLQLKANVNESVGQSLKSSCFGNGLSEETIQHQTQCTVHCTETCNNSNLQADLVKTQGNEKRSRKHKEITVKASSGVKRKRGQPQDQTQNGDGPEDRHSCEENYNNKIPSTSSASNENNTDQLDMLTATNAPGFIFSKPVDEEGEAPVPKYSEMLNDVDLRAPDNFVPALDNSNAEVEIPKGGTCTVNDELIAAEIFVSKECITESHLKDEMDIASASDNSEKSDLDPVGHDIARSMMTVLLPRALPLLKTPIEKETSPNCRKDPLHGMSHEEKKGLSLEDHPPELEIRSSSDQFQLEKLNGVHIPGKDFTLNFQVDKQNRTAPFSSTDMGSHVPNLEDSTSVAPASFENDQCEFRDYSQVRQLQDESISLYEMYHEKTDDTISRWCTEETISTVDAKSTSGASVDHVAEEGTRGHTGGAGAANVSFMSNLDIASSTSYYNTPHSESAFSRDSIGNLVLEKFSSRKHVPASGVLLYNEMRPIERSNCPQMRTPPTVSNGTSSDMAKVTENEDYVWRPDNNCTSHVFGALPNSRRKPQASGYNEVDVPVSSLRDQRASFHDMTEKKEAQDELRVNTLNKMMHNDELGNIFELIGCYMHPMPISLVMLRTKGNDIYICVLCGYLMEKDRTLFMYRVSIKGERRGRPSFTGHAKVVSPELRNISGRQTSLDSSCLQFTPDGKCLVLLNNIKAPYCREGNVNCQCSVCKSYCFEKNAVKIVQVKLGYIQVLTKLKTTNKVCCILVCEPSHLMAAEESGRLHLWTMNSTWSAKIKENYLPTSGYMPNYIVELKKIPNFPSLVVGHNAFGDFCLWDIKRRVLVSKFSTPRTSFLRFLPINLFRCPSQAFVATGASRKEQVADIMGETQIRALETGRHASFLVNEEDVSLVLLISSVLNLDLHNGFGPVGGWSLALLAKHKLIWENPLDPSASIVGASAGYGIMGTSDGFLYIWELATGTKLGHLSHCRGATVSCLAADDSDSGAFAVVVDGSQLQVYAPGTAAS